MITEPAFEVVVVSTENPLKDLYEAIEVYKQSPQTEADLAALYRVDAQVLGSLQSGEVTLPKLTLGKLEKVKENAREGYISADLQCFIVDLIEKRERAMLLENI